MTPKTLLLEASNAKLTKKTVDNEDKDFDIKKKADFEGVDSEDFLLPFEKHYLLGAMLERLQVGSLTAISSHHYLVVTDMWRFRGLVQNTEEKCRPY